MSIVPRNYKTTYTTIVTRNMNFVLHCTICEELIKRRGRMINIRYKLLKSHSIVEVSTSEKDPTAFLEFTEN